MVFSPGRYFQEPCFPHVLSMWFSEKIRTTRGWITQISISAKLKISDILTFCLACHVSQALIVYVSLPIIMIYDIIYCSTGRYDPVHRLSSCIANVWIREQRRRSTMTVHDVKWFLHPLWPEYQRIEFLGLLAMLNKHVQSSSIPPIVILFYDITFNPLWKVRFIVVVEFSLRSVHGTSIHVLAWSSKDLEPCDMI